MDDDNKPFKDRVNDMVDILSAEFWFCCSASGDQGQSDLFFGKSAQTFDVFGSECQRHLGESGKVDSAQFGLEAKEMYQCVTLMLYKP